MQTATRIDTLAAVVKLLANDAWSLHTYRIPSVSRGRVTYTSYFNIMADYHDTDTRVCVRVEYYANSTYIEANELHGYDADKHCWTVEGTRYRTCLEHKHGRKPLEALVDSIYENGHSYACSGAPRGFSAMKRNGKFIVS